MSQEIVFYTVRKTPVEYYLYQCGRPEYKAHFKEPRYSDRINSVEDVEVELVNDIRMILNINTGSSVHLSRAYVLSRPAINRGSFDWIIEFPKEKRRMALKVYKVTFFPNSIGMDEFGHIKFSESKFEDVDLGNFPKVLDLVVESFISRIKGISELNEVEGIKKEIEMFPEETRKLLSDKLRDRLAELQKIEVDKVRSGFSKVISEIK